MPDFTSFTPEAVLTILGMAVVTYGMRLGGLLMADRLPQTGRWAHVLERLPGAVLISVWVPSALSAGLIGIVGATATLLAMIMTRNLFAAMIAGMGLVAAGRYFFGA
ncbi:branched-chain amino acid ABC transporter [Thalassospira profundimaris]|uniref:Branched-chain amino acid ABC transporter n=1 Tax=Thalassospira profundimaris TaxID=502049 RepID=A0A367WRJ3_9PROT|nr:AzlD domain-containing protein [Thalassospira profundimaris]RCK44095.1 branched-chain amino acid ABC transporter [Thalassospira profundimaris]